MYEQIKVVQYAFYYVGMRMQIMRNAIAIRSHCVRILIQIFNYCPKNTISKHPVLAYKLLDFVIRSRIIIMRKIKCVHR